MACRVAIALLVGVAACTDPSGPPPDAPCTEPIAPPRGDENPPDPTAPIPAFDGPVTSMLHAGSSWYVGGNFTRLSPYRAQGLVQLSTDGRVAGCLGGFDGVVGAMVRSGTALFVSGTFTSFHGAPADGIAKLDVATCTLDTTFVAGGFGGYPVFALVVAGTSVFAGGFFSSYGGAPAFSIAKLDSTTGALDTTFNPPAANGFTDNTTSQRGVVYALAVSGNSLLVGGAFADYRGVTDSARSLAKLDIASGAIDTTFSPVGASNNGFECTLGVTCLMTPSVVRTLAVDGNALFAGGSFSRYRGVELSDIRLAKIDVTTGALDTTFTQSGPALTTEGEVKKLTIAGGDLVIDGAFGPTDTYRGEFVSGVFAVDPATGVVTRNFYLDSSISAYTFSDDAMYYVTGGRSIGKYWLATLEHAEFRSDLGPAIVDGEVNTLVVDGDTLWVSGAFAAYSGRGIDKVVKLDDKTFQQDYTFRAPNLAGVDELAIGGPSVCASHNGLLFAAHRGGLASLDAESGVPAQVRAYERLGAPIGVSDDALFLTRSTMIGGGPDSYYEHEVVRLDVHTGELVAAYPPGRTAVVAMAAVGDALFVCREGHVQKLHIATGELDATFSPLEQLGMVTACTAANDALFVANVMTEGHPSEPTAEILKLDTTTGARDGAFTAGPMDGTVRTIAASSAALFVGLESHYYGDPGAEVLVRLDAATGAIDSGFHMDVPDWAFYGTSVSTSSVVPLGSHLYVGGTFPGTVTILDPATGAVR